MNKSNKVLLGVLSFVVVCVVGYALFSETITVTGTATAKGNFEITATSLNLDLEENKLLYGANSYYSGDFENPTINIADNVVTSNVILKSPGSGYSFGVAFTNTGTIPAKLKTIRNLTTNKVLLDKNTQEYDFDYYVGEEGKNLIGAELFSEDGYLYDYEYKPEDYIRTACYPDTGMLEAILDPGESMYFFITYFWHINSIEPGKDLDLNWSLEFEYEQVITE